MHISLDEGTAKRSLPVTHGSVIGDAIRSSHCAVSASPPVGSKTRATFWSNGLAPFHKACCRTGSPTRASSLSSTPLTHHSGTSLLLAIICWRRRNGPDSPTIVTPNNCALRLRRFLQATPLEPVSAFARKTTDSLRPVNTASS